MGAGGDAQVEEWVDPKTGEIVEEGTKGAVRIEPIDVKAEEPAEERPDCEWLPDYYTKRLAGWAAKERLLDRQYARRIAQLRADRASFKRYYASQIRAEVQAEMMVQRRCSVDYAYGRLGFRSIPGKFEVQDKAVVIKWAQENTPWAIKNIPAKVDLLKSGLPKGAKVPGAKWLPPTNRFFDDCEVR